MKDRIAKFREYLDYVERHYDNVQKAWKLINEKCRGKDFRFLTDDYIWHTIDSKVKVHDMSKLSKDELTQYRQFFFPTEHETKDKAAFKKAWEHHKEHNDHHWQNWTVNFKDHPHADIFLIENIVDWMAMGFEYGDTAKEYYENNRDEIKLPSWAIELMYKIFECVYSTSD